MRALPNIAVLAPADPVETRLATQALLECPGPSYLRLGKAGEPAIHENTPSFLPGKPIEVADGRDVLVVSTGTMLGVALKVRSLAESNGLHVAVWSCPWLKPVDEPAITEAGTRFSLIVSLEEGQSTGGLGGTLAEILAALPGPHARLLRLGVPDMILTESYSQESARTRIGLDATAIRKAILNARSSDAVPKE